MGKYLKIAREARRQREAEQGIPQPKERPVYWRGMDGQLRGPVTVEEVANTDGTLWVCFTWQGRMFWVQARLIEGPPSDLSTVTRRRPGPRHPSPDRCEACGDTAALAWSVPQQRWVCLTCFDPKKG